MTTPVNQIPYLRTSRNFPSEVDDLVIELGKSYIDTALAINDRTIGIYPATRPAITGNNWFFLGKKQQTLRQIYDIPIVAGVPQPILHGIPFNQISRIVQTYGNFTDGTNWYGLIAGSNVAIAGQISFYLSPTAIVFLIGAGAPAITSGNIVLEWLSDI